jgi:zinc protease
VAAVTHRILHGPTIVVAPVPGLAASVVVRFDAGSADEAVPGVAHFLEHMLFKGTPTHGIGEAARRIEATGGDLNAYTSHDELVLQATVADGDWRTALGVVLDMVREASVDPAEVERERLVIAEEIAAYAGDPDDALSEAVQAALWPDHPFGRPVIGTADSVANLGARDLETYRRTHLGGDRALVVVVAEADPDEVVAAVRAGTRGWHAGNARPERPPVPPVDGPVVVRPHGRFDDRAVELAWRGPAPDHPDAAALAVLCAILGPTAGDRLAEALDEAPKLGFATYASLVQTAATPSIHIGFRPLPDRTIDALRRVRELIERYQRSVGGRLVARARETLLADLDFEDQTVEGLADDLLSAVVTTGGTEGRATWRHALASVTSDDVARVARTWLVPEALVVGVLDPSVTVLGVRRAVRPSVVPKAPVRPGVHTVHGTRVAIQTEAVPVFAARIVLPGGTLAAPDGPAGLAEAWSRTVHRGAGRYDGEAFHDALDDLAAELEPVGGRAALSLSVTAPAHHATDLLTLLGELILDPHLEESEWSLVREELQDSVRTRLDRPHEVVEDETAARRFHGHPYHLPSGGTLASLGRIGGKALRRFHDQHAVAGRPSIALVGGVGPDEAIEALSWLADLPRGSAAPTEPRWPPLRPSLTHVQAGTRQSVVSLVGDGAPADTDDEVVFEVIEALLDGQAGRLFLDLREVRGLAYDLWARHTATRGGGALQLGLACDPRRVEEASSGVREVLEALVTRPPTDDELDRARAMLLGAEVLRAQRVDHRAARLAGWLLTGRDPSPEARRKRLAAVGRDDVARAVRHVLEVGFVEVRSVPRGR